MAKLTFSGVVALLCLLDVNVYSGFLPFMNKDVCIQPMSAPAPRSEREAEHRRTVDAVLSHFWQRHEGYGIAEDEEDEITRVGEALDTGKRPSTYGEITPIGVRQIARATGLDDLDGNATFLDLGSGVGKFVAQAYLEWPGVRRAIGVELSASRSDRASVAWNELVASGDKDELRSMALSLANSSAQHNDEDIIFLRGDLFAADVSDATHIYVASLCFSDGMLSRLAIKLAAEASQVRYIASLRRFPETIAGFEKPTFLEADMSWTAARGGGSSVYLYRRREGGPAAISVDGAQTR